MCQVPRFGFRAYYLSLGNRITYPSKGLKGGMEDTKNPPSRGLIMIPPSDHVLHMPLWFLESLGHAPRRVWLRPLASSWLQIIISLKRRSSIRSMCKSPKFKNTSHGIPGHLRVHAHGKPPSGRGTSEYTLLAHGPWFSVHGSVSDL